MAVPVTDDPDASHNLEDSAANPSTYHGSNYSANASAHHGRYNGSQAKGAQRLGTKISASCSDHHTARFRNRSSDPYHP